MTLLKSILFLHLGLPFACSIAAMEKYNINEDIGRTFKETYRNIGLENVEEVADNCAVEEPKKRTRGDQINKSNLNNSTNERLNHTYIYTASAGFVGFIIGGTVAVTALMYAPEKVLATMLDIIR